MTPQGVSGKQALPTACGQLPTQPFANERQGHALGQRLEHLLSPRIHLQKGAGDETNLR